MRALDGTGRTLTMGRPAGWIQKLTARGAMRSPGAPSLRCEIERKFWDQIATGITSEKAAEAVGVSQAVGSRWFRYRGGMPLFMSNPISGRYLSFAEREEIGLLRIQGVGIREIARRLGRSPSTVSRELTRNAATRGGRLEYRASVAQWKAELVAKRPKPSKLVPSYGYRRVWALVRRDREQQQEPPVNAKRVYRVMRDHGLLLERRRQPLAPARRHDGQVAVLRSNQRWCSDGFEFRYDDGSPLRVTFALDCCDREAMSWSATTAGHSGDVVRNVMLAALEHRFGNTDQTPQQIEWLSDNGSGYIASKTREFARRIGLKPLTTPVRSPQSNGMAESFVKTIKRDYVAFMPKPDVPTALQNLAIAFEHYNERHPHSSLKYRSPREFRRHQDLSTQG